MDSGTNGMSWADMVEEDLAKETYNDDPSDDSDPNEAKETAKQSPPSWASVVEKNKDPSQRSIKEVVVKASNNDDGNNGNDDTRKEDDNTNEQIAQWHSYARTLQAEEAAERAAKRAAALSIADKEEVKEEEKKIQQEEEPIKSLSSSRWANAPPSTSAHSYRSEFKRSNYGDDRYGNDGFNNNDYQRRTTFSRYDGQQYNNSRLDSDGGYQKYNNNRYGNSNNSRYHSDGGYRKYNNNRYDNSNNNRYSSDGGQQKYNNNRYDSGNNNRYDSDGGSQKYNSNNRYDSDGGNQRYSKNQYDRHGDRSESADVNSDTMNDDSGYNKYGFRDRDNRYNSYNNNNDNNSNDRSYSRHDRGQGSSGTFTEDRTSRPGPRAVTSVFSSSSIQSPSMEHSGVRTSKWAATSPMFDVVSYSTEETTINTQEPTIAQLTESFDAVPSVDLPPETTQITDITDNNNGSCASEVNQQEQQTPPVRITTWKDVITVPTENDDEAGLASQAWKRAASAAPPRTRRSSGSPSITHSHDFGSTHVGTAHFNEKMGDNVTVPTAMAWGSDNSMDQSAQQPTCQVDLHTNQTAATTDNQTETVTATTTENKDEQTTAALSSVSSSSWGLNNNNHQRTERTTWTANEIRNEISEEVTSSWSTNNGGNQGTEATETRVSSKSNHEPLSEKSTWEVSKSNGSDNVSSHTGQQTDDFAHSIQSPSDSVDKTNPWQQFASVHVSRQAAPVTIVHHEPSKSMASQPAIHEGEYIRLTKETQVTHAAKAPEYTQTVQDDSWEEMQQKMQHSWTT